MTPQQFITKWAGLQSPGYTWQAKSDTTPTLTILPSVTGPRTTTVLPATAM